MLDIQNSRLNYGKLLAPPIGFDLIKAVGTTYSLDLQALLAIPISLFYAKTMDGDFTMERIDVLDALRKSQEKLTLFCQRGKIKVPNNYHSLFGFMDDCVIEQTPSQKNASFHPKIWVLRFENKEKIKYRLIVLSRNLTFDRSWDIAYYADGIPTNVEDKHAKKLSDYIKELYINTDKQDEIDVPFLEDLCTVKFDVPYEFKDFEIHPILPKSKSFINPVSKFHYKDLLIISPFVNKTALEALKTANNNITLVSRKEELDRLENGVLNGLDVYCLKDVIVNGEDYIDTEGVETQSQNLHAKIFIGQNDKQTDWYLGSANCTSAAMINNTELLVKVSSTGEHLRLEKVKEKLLHKEPSYFEEYKRSEIEVDEEKEKLEEEIRSLLFELCKKEFFGRVTETHNENYTVHLEVDLTWSYSKRLKLYASLLHKSEEVELVFGQINHLTFSNIPITALSKYLVLNFYENTSFLQGSLIKMNIEIPAKRGDEIFKSLINNKVRFYKYLQFLLSPEDLQHNLYIEASTNFERAEGKIDATQSLLGLNMPIYESLMISASRSPEKLREIDKIVEKLKDMEEGVVEDFLPVWEVFKEFAHE